MQNDKWASGDIADQAVENLLVLWIVTVVWNAVSIPAVIPYVRDAINSNNKLQLLTLAVPAVGVGLLVWALRRTLRITKYGASVFHLQTLPATPGGELAGTIHVARHLEAGSGMELRLMCINRIETGYGKHHNVVEHTLWSEAQKLERLPACDEGSDIPVLFHIPSDARPCDDADFQNRILWRLEARCAAAGISYLSRFEVPVFVVAHSNVETAGKPLASPEHRQTTGVLGRFSEAGIVCRPIGGGLQIHFGLARNKSSARVTSGVALGFIIAAIALGLFPVPDLMRVVPLVFACVFLLIGGLFGYIAFFLWFVSVDVTARRGSLDLVTGIPIYRRRRTFNAREITDIICKVDGGSSIGDGARKVSYGIQMKMRDGGTNWIGNNMVQGEFAGYMADEIRTIVGVAGSADS
jgi:hypothetical protein